MQRHAPGAARHDLGEMDLAAREDREMGEAPEQSFGEVEIAPAVASSLHSVIEEQVTNGVAVRMAVLYLICRGRA